MERKVYAEIEFQTKGRSRKKDRENICEYLPSEVTKCSYEYPLKIIVPDSVTDAHSQWVYPIIFGGGLVEGDNVNLSFTIGGNCCVVITTMSFPKVYCCENGKSSQQNSIYRIDSHSMLCVLCDPVSCFEKASYSQSQIFHLTSYSNLVLLDWFTSGRYIRGERWIFSKLRSISSIYIDGILEFKEAQVIQDTPFLKLKDAMKSYNIIGSCMVLGPNMECIYSHILTSLGKCRAYGEKPNPNVLFAVSTLHRNGSSEAFGCIFRFAGVSVLEVTSKIEELLIPLYPVIGGNPFRNK